MSPKQTLLMVAFFYFLFSHSNRNTMRSLCGRECTGSPLECQAELLDSLSRRDLTADSNPGCYLLPERRLTATKPVYSQLVRHAKSALFSGYTFLPQFSLLLPALLGSSTSGPPALRSCSMEPSLTPFPHVKLTLSLCRLF